MTAKQKKKSSVTATVIIPCYNGKKTIRQTLGGVCGQKTDFTFEVIVVDSSNDGTDDMIQSEFPNIHLIHLNERTLPGSGRNLGIRNARGDIVAFTDADAVPDPDWLQQIVSIHQSRETDGVGGCVINGYPKSLTAWISHLLEFNEWTHTTAAGYVNNIPSVNISFKRDTFYKYHICFSDVFPSEDTMLNWSLVERGGKIFFDPSIRVLHLNRVGFSRLLTHQLRLGRASGHARRRSTLPGRLFVMHPWLSPFLPLIRWLRISMRLIKKDRLLLFLFLILTPFILLSMIAWTIGFIQHSVYSNPKIIVNGCDFDVFGTKRDAS